MNRSATYPYGETEHITCSCGAQLEISIAKQDGHNEKEDFNCPKCGAEHLVRASMPIKTGDIKIVKVDE